VSRSCPDPLESPSEGKEERRIEGGKEVAWTGSNQRFITDCHHCCQDIYATLSTASSSLDVY